MIRRRGGLNAPVFRSCCRCAPDREQARSYRSKVYRSTVGASNWLESDLRPVLRRDPVGASNCLESDLRLVLRRGPVGASLLAKVLDQAVKMCGLDWRCCQQAASHKQKHTMIPVGTSNCLESDSRLVLRRDPVGTSNCLESDPRLVLRRDPVGGSLLAKVLDQAVKMCGLALSPASCLPQAKTHHDPSGNQQLS